MYENGILPNEYKHETAKASYTGFSELSHHQVSELEQEYFKFTIVRNPWSRLASAYLDKIYNESGSMKTLKTRDVLKYYKRKHGKSITYREFCNFLKFGDGLCSNPHWAPQSALINMPISQLDVIGKCETFEDDLTYLVKRLFNVLDNELLISNGRHHKPNANSHLHELYDDYTRNIVRELCEDDFVNFGYDMTEVNYRES